MLAAHDALDLLAGGDTFDLILCDLMMPDMTGMELTFPSNPLMQTSAFMRANCCIQERQQENEFLLPLALPV